MSNSFCSPLRRSLKDHFLMLQRAKRTLCPPRRNFMEVHITRQQRQQSTPMLHLASVPFWHCSDRSADSKQQRVCEQTASPEWGLHLCQLTAGAFLQIPFIEGVHKRHLFHAQAQMTLRELKKCMFEVGGRGGQEQLAGLYMVIPPGPTTDNCCCCSFWSSWSAMVFAE